MEWNGMAEVCNFGDLAVPYLLNRYRMQRMIPVFFAAAADGWMIDDVLHRCGFFPAPLQQSRKDHAPLLEFH